MASLQKTMMLLFAASTAAVVMSAEIRSDSTIGQKVLSKARPLDEGRQLDNQYTQWMTGYSLKFAGCHSVPQFEREEGIRSTLLAKFKLCPEDQCSSCPNAGEYIVEMRDFVEAYQDAQMSLHEYECETQQETCEYQCQNGYYDMGDDDGDDYFNNYNNGNGNNQNNNNNNGNDNNNEEYCYYKCMSDSGLSYCDNDNQNDGNDMNMEEMSECRMMGEDNQNNNNGYYNSNYQIYYVGAYCTSTGVYVDTFTDSMCTNKAPSGTYEKYSGGYSLPTDPLVGTDCLSCKYSENDNQNNNGENNNGNNNNNNGNNYNYYQVSEVCENLYEDAGKCEKNMKDKQYANNGACDLMHGTLARLDAAFKNERKASVVFAWLFGIGFFVLGGYVFFLHKKIIKREDNAEIGKYFGAGAGASLS